MVFLGGVCVSGWLFDCDNLVLLFVVCLLVAVIGCVVWVFVALYLWGVLLFGWIDCVVWLLLCVEFLWCCLC